MRIGHALSQFGKNILLIQEEVGIDKKDFAKIFLTLSTFIGMCLISFYIYWTLTPLPPFDSSFGLTLATFMISFMLVFAVYLFLFFLPIVFNISEHNFYYNLFPILSSQEDNNRKRILPYIVLFFPSILNIAFHFYYFHQGKMIDYAFSVYNFSVFSISSIFSIVLIIILCRKKEIKPKIPICFYFVLKENMIYIFWLYVAFMAFFLFNDDFYDKTLYYSIDGSRVSSSDQYAITMGSYDGPPRFAVPMILALAHFSQTALAPKIKNLSINALLFLLLFFGSFPGANGVTAHILKILGFGGGIYSEINVKSLDNDGKNKFDRYEGCIMLSTSSVVVFKISSSMKSIPKEDLEGRNKDCSVLAKNKKKDSAYKFYSVDTYIINRSDIQMIKIPNSGRSILNP